jgi:hypothetical protein
MPEKKVLVMGVYKYLHSSTTRTTCGICEVKTTYPGRLTESGITYEPKMKKQCVDELSPLTCEITCYNVTFEVSTAATMKNVIFWDNKTQFLPHKRHITSLLQSPAS